MMPSLAGYLDPIKPYFLAIKYGLAVAVLAAIFVGGCTHGVKVQTEKDAKIIQGKNSALHTAADKLHRAYLALDASAGIFRTIEAEAKRRVAADELARRQNTAATQLAAKAEAQLAKQNRDFAKKLKHARENPDCNVLMAMDLEAKCGL